MIAAESQTLGMPRTLQPPNLLFEACDEDTSICLQVLQSYSYQAVSQSSLMPVARAWLSGIASVLSGSRGGAVKLEGVAGVLAPAELPSLS